MFAHRKDVDVDFVVSAWKIWSLPAALEHLKFFVAERAGLAGKCAVLDVSCPAMLVPQAVIDAAIPTLVQILRNAVEHGVETPVARLVAGKPLMAIIELSVTLEGGTISARINDDGAGIDHDAVLGLERILVTAAPGGQSNIEADGSHAVLARLGIVASDRNARGGTGLQRAVARITPVRGELRFASNPGRGTVFSLTIDKEADTNEAHFFDRDGLSGSMASPAGGSVD